MKSSNQTILVVAGVLVAGYFLYKKSQKPAAPSTPLIEDSPVMSDASGFAKGIDIQSPDPGLNAAKVSVYR